MHKELAIETQPRPIETSQPVLDEATRNAIFNELNELKLRIHVTETEIKDMKSSIAIVNKDFLQYKEINKPTESILVK